ncbi:MAG: methyltransferase domain-containing protein [Candidatus Flexifilum sp.]|jgi:SAM-dependent methyltransferase
MFPAEYFRKQDESGDELFYTVPRKVVHIDDGAIRALTGQLTALLPRSGTILDLMSSWRSHLPTDRRFERVVGLGMNAEEMADNPQLDEYVVHDLNRNPLLPFTTAAFDAAVCTVSVQYLTNPVAVFTEVARVLKPGGRFIVSFSNRCFPTKAVAIWLALNDRQRVALVTRYFEAAGRWTKITAWGREAGRTPAAWFGGGDPLYLVWAEAAPAG